MIRQLKYKILKNCTTQYIGGGRGGNIPRGKFFYEDTRLQAQTWKGRGWEVKAILDLHSPFSPSFPFPCIACDACHAWPFIPSASILRKLWEQRYCWKCNIPDLTRHGCCHQIRWNVILLSWNIKTDYCVSLKSLSRYFDLQKITWATFFVSYFTPFYHFITRGQKVSDSFMS